MVVAAAENAAAFNATLKSAPVAPTLPPCCIAPAFVVTSNTCCCTSAVPALKIESAGGEPAPRARLCHSPATAAAVGFISLFQSARKNFPFVVISLIRLSWLLKPAMSYAHIVSISPLNGAAASVPDG